MTVIRQPLSVENMFWRLIEKNCCLRWTKKRRMSTKSTQLRRLMWLIWAKYAGCCYSCYMLWIGWDVLKPEIMICSYITKKLKFQCRLQTSTNDIMLMSDFTIFLHFKRLYYHQTVFSFKSWNCHLTLKCLVHLRSWWC